MSDDEMIVESTHERGDAQLIAKKYAKSEQEMEEYISIGTIGLIKAINSFKDNKGFKKSLQENPGRGLM